MEKEKTNDLLMGERTVFRNKNGETIFGMRRKDCCGQIYFTFELHRDRMEPETLVKFENLWPTIKTVAALYQIPLYDIAEVHEQSNKYMAEHRKELADQLRKIPLGTQYDVQLSVTDVAVNQKKLLTMGISLPESIPADAVEIVLEGIARGDYSII